MRLDKALFDRGLVQSRSRAQELVRDGFVEVRGAVCLKPAAWVGPEDAIKILENTNTWVSRAALKLVHGLDVFQFDFTRGVVLDIGASTGGFTEVMLARGATRVYALDVGHGQLHARLLSDPRVVNMEGTNAKNLAPNALPLLDFIVSDVSFISLVKALPIPLGFAKPGGHLIALIKPQFEVGRGRVGKGGIVKDQAARDGARADVRAFLEAQNWTIIGETESPIKGSDGNVEYFICARKNG